MAGNLCFHTIITELVLVACLVMAEYPHKSKEGRVYFAQFEGAAIMVRKA